eukprot:scaffold2830_cov32-Cyclotella_meneghiniana.AAC.4
MARQQPESGANGRTDGRTDGRRSDNQLVQRRRRVRIGRVVERRTGGKTTINRRFDSPLKRELTASSP